MHLTLGLLSGVSLAQSGGTPAQPLSGVSTSRNVPFDVSGRVFNLRTHQPIARALVQLGGRRVLTDHDGVFKFPSFASPSGSFLVTKPGFFPESDNGDSRAYSFSSDAGIELGLWPEAILSGTVVNPSGEGIADVFLMARGSIFDETGQHWRSSGQARTQSDGSFRLSLPQGSYVLQLRSPGRPTAGLDMVQPLSVPASASIREAISLAPGDQVHLDLHPEVRRAYLVTLSADAGSERGFPMISARTANGVPITLTATPAHVPGEFTVALPNGTYELAGTRQTQEGREQAQASVTVAGHDVLGPVLHFSPTPSLSLVVEVDTSSTSDNAAGSTSTPPTPQQLNVSLQSVTGPGDLNDLAYRVETRRDQAPAFALPNGVYRLRVQSSGEWFITAASCGGSDLLRQNLIVAPGMDSREVRVRVSNQIASLQGRVTLRGAASSAWVYLIATTPSPTPVQMLRVGSAGTFYRNLAPGSYRAIALEHRINADLQNAETLNRFPGRVQTFTVGVGEQHALTLDAVPAGEITQ